MKIYNLANKLIIQMTCDFQFEPQPASLMICGDSLVRAGSEYICQTKVHQTSGMSHTDTMKICKFC